MTARRTLVLPLVALLAAWIALPGRELVAPAAVSRPGADETAGRRVWRAANCGACHRLAGRGGSLASDLTSVLERRGVVAVRDVLVNGRPDMPDVDLDRSEIEDLIAWLRQVEATWALSVATEGLGAADG